MIKTTIVAAALASITILSYASAAEAGGITRGGASWYALRSRTASGEMMNPAAMTAAHKTLPLGSKVKVTNLSNNRSVVVRINDRGPFSRDRMIDLSRAAAEQVGLVASGHGTVRLALISS